MISGEPNVTASTVMVGLKDDVCEQAKNIRIVLDSPGRRLKTVLGATVIGPGAGFTENVPLVGPGVGTTNSPTCGGHSGSVITCKNEKSACDTVKAKV